MKTEIWEKLSDITELACKGLYFVAMSGFFLICAAAFAAVFMMLSYSETTFRVAAALLICGASMFFIGMGALFLCMRVHRWTFDKFIDSWEKAVGERPVEIDS